MVWLVKNYGMHPESTHFAEYDRCCDVSFLVDDVVSVLHLSESKGSNNIYIKHLQDNEGLDPNKQLRPARAVSVETRIRNETEWCVGSASLSKKQSMSFLFST